MTDPHQHMPWSVLMLLTAAAMTTTASIGMIEVTTISGKPTTTPAILGAGVVFTLMMMATYSAFVPIPDADRDAWAWPMKMLRVIAAGMPLLLCVLPGLLAGDGVRAFLCGLAPAFLILLRVYALHRATLYGPSHYQPPTKEPQE